MLAHQFPNDTNLRIYVCFNFTEDNIRVIETPEKSDDVNYNLTNYVKFSLLLNTIMNAIVAFEVLHRPCTSLGSTLEADTFTTHLRRLSVVTVPVLQTASSNCVCDEVRVDHFLLCSSVLNLRIRPLYKHRLLTVLG